MATAPKKMQVNSWESEMAASAVIAAKAESRSQDRPFFSTSGQLKFQGAVLPSGAAVVVLDQIHANLYYQGAYNPDSPASPECFAFGRDTVNAKTGEVEVIGIDTHDGRTAMAPHKDVKNRVCDQCEGCPMNEWASGVGKGKACQNTRRLAVIPGGTIDSKGSFAPFTKSEQLDTAQVGYIKLPTMSVAGFSKLISDTAKALERPLWSMYTLLRVIPNPSGRLPATIVDFSQLDKIPNGLMDSVFKRMKAQLTETAFPFAPNTAAPAPAAKAKRKYT
jgi:hypothetical protein